MTTPVQLFFAAGAIVVAWWKAIRRAWFSEAVIITLGTLLILSILLVGYALFVGFQ
jgi:hypothetical protein